MTTRLSWLLAGAAWAVRSSLELARPNYYEPATVLDWSAVASYSLAWLLSAIAVLLLVRDLASRAPRVLGLVFAIAATVAGVANAVEDALDQAWGGLPYVVGFVVAWVVLVPLAVLLWRSGARHRAILPLAAFVAIALFNLGGGLILLVVSGAFALRPRRFEERRVATSPT